ncbi:MAG: EAL domain-containing protein, partial [Halothiobacillaceae bacterium]
QVDRRGVSEEAGYRQLRVTQQTVRAVGFSMCPFVQNITRNQPGRAIVRAVVAIAQSMGLATVAEGVEGQRQVDFLDALGIQEIQGLSSSLTI